MRLLLWIFLSFSVAHAAPQKLQVVVSFSILEDMALHIGGDKVTVTSLVGRNADMHSFEPKPADAKRLKKADIFLVNGLGLEGFVTRLVQSSSFKGDVVEATHGITPIKAEEEKHEEHGHGHDHHDHGTADPHAWQSIKNAIIYANNIATAFAAKDPANKNYYGERLKDYVRRLQEKDAWAKAEIAKIPVEKRSVVVPHNSFAYFARDYGIQFVAPQGLSTQDEPSAEDIARIIDAVREKKASAIFTENVTPSPVIKQVAEEAKLPIGGQLFSDALSEKDGKAYTYMEFFTANVDALVKALKK